MTFQFATRKLFILKKPSSLMRFYLTDRNGYFENYPNPVVCYKNAVTNAARSLLLQNHLFSIYTHQCRQKAAITYVTQIQNSQEFGRRETDESCAGIKNILQKHLEMTGLEAELALLTNPKLKNVNVMEVEAAINFLISRNFGVIQMKNNFWLLLLSKDDIQRKLAYIESEFGNMRDGLVAMLGQDDKVMKQCITRLLEDKKAGIDRVNYLIQELEITESELGPLLRQHAVVFTMKFQRLKSFTDLLKLHGVNGNVIRQDLWLFHRCSYNRTNRRLNELNKRSVAPIQTWMFRCSDVVFNRSLVKQDQRMAVLRPHSDVVGYLAERLQRSEENIRREIIQKNPFMLKVNPPKVKEVLDVLFAEGFQPEQVIAAPRVFEMSVTSLQQRLNEMKQLGHKPLHLRILWIEWKRFHQYIDNLKINVQNETSVCK